MVKDKGDTDQFRIQAMSVTHSSVFEELITVITNDRNEGVIKHIVLFQESHQLTQIRIIKGDFSVIHRFEALFVPVLQLDLPSLNLGQKFSCSRICNFSLVVVGIVKKRIIFAETIGDMRIA